MRKDYKEKLVRKVREAQEYPFPQEHPFLVELGKKAVNPSRVPHLAKDLGLKVEEEKLIKWVAVFKREVLEENPKADFPKILEEIHKESKMDKNLSSKERVKKLKERMRARNEAEKKEVKEEREEEIKRFLILVVEEFEREVQSLESEIGLVSKLVKRFHADSLDDNGFDEVVGKLEEMGFVIEHFGKSPSRWMDVILYEKPKKRTGVPGSSI